MRMNHSQSDNTSRVSVALDILLDRREHIMVIQDEFGGTRGLLSMEDIIETLLVLKIVDEEDLDAIEEWYDRGRSSRICKEKARLKQ